MENLSRNIVPDQIESKRERENFSHGVRDKGPERVGGVFLFFF